MRILFVHNYYGSSAPSGENRVFKAEVKMLKEHGHEVQCFTRHSDEIRDKGIMGLVKGALSTPWNPFASHKLKGVLKLFKPDVVHVHNTFPLISPAIFHTIGNLASCVLTLHNYRIFCPAALPFRDGHICTECIDRKSVWPSLQHACYRGSRLATLPLAISVALHRMLGTWTDHVDAFIILSDFQRKVVINAGLPESLLHLKPNFYPGIPSVVPWNQRGSYIVYVGRLTPEKGVKTLIRAWQLWGKNAPELHIIGDGELRSELEKMAKDLPIKFLGQMDSSSTHSEIAHSQLLVLPSECFEGSPMAVIEAYAFGTPVAVSDIGPLPSLIRNGECGLTFQFSNPSSLFEEIQSTWDKKQILEEFGRCARNEFDTYYTEDANYTKLLDIYNKAIFLSSRHQLKNSSV